MRRATTFLAAAAVALSAAAEPPPVRLAYNYCTLSYTFAYYGESEWSAEIDRLAAAGYNVALVADGTFKVWELTLRELGMQEKDILAFIPDECARAWWLMGNLAGEGGPLDQKTIDADGERGRFIVRRMLEKGVEPVLQGFFGMVPAVLRGPGGKELATIPQGKWSCYERPPVLDPTSPEFADVAAVWYRNLEKVYGVRPRFLAGDLFHEGGRTGGVDVTAAVRAVQSAQQTAFPGVTWVVQAWQSNPTAEVRAGLDPGHTLIEALVRDMSAFAKDDAVCDLDYGDLPWIWCEVLNFGGNHGMYGSLRTFARLGRAAKGRGAKTFRGYGSLSEGFFTNPVCCDMFEEMMMRPAGSEMTDAELGTWLDAWVARRYGTDDERLRGAWRLLAGTVYDCPRCQEGTVENVICAEPSWNANNASTWGPKGGLWYNPLQLVKALKMMDAARDAVVAASPARSVPQSFACDRYDLARQIWADRLRGLVPRMRDEPQTAREFVETARLQCSETAMRAAPGVFRLSTWDGLARRRAGERGVRAWRRMITTWADPKYGRTTLSDYANREYPELVRDWYLPRWENFLGE